MVLAAVLLQLLYLRVYAARVAFFSHPTGDSAIYLELAGRVATGAGPSGSYRAPAYQYLLALPLKLGQGRLAWVYLCQVLMNAGTLVLVYLLGRRLAGRVAGTAALVLAGLSAPLWFYASKVVSATPVVLLVALGALLVLSGRWWRWPAAGLAFGAAALCWPGSILVALGVAGMGLLLGQASWRRVGLLAAGGLLAVAPVTVRNAAAMRDFVPISANGGFTFYQGNNRLALGTLAQPPEMYEPGPDGTVRTGVGEQEAFDSGYAATALNRPVRRSAASWFWTGRALAWMRRHPADYLRLLGRKLVLAFSDYDSATEYDLAMERELVWPLRLGFVGFGLLLALAAAGLVLAGSRRLWPAYGVVAGTLLALLVFYVNGRYRLAMVPALAVLGGNGVAAFA
ncbi:hypothetical protein FJY71_05600, partial [candidate division WOR-3 bacterium]|nr:hypothetical protein [candidate division WOR-3 bacterium]